MKARALLLLVILLPIRDMAFAFIKVETMPFSVRGVDGFTSYWNESYLLTVDDMQLQLVAGTAEISDGSGVQTINWDPEIVSIKIDGNEIMRRTGVGDFISNDPFSRMPFLGIGGLASPLNYVKRQSPLCPPVANLTWVSMGQEGILAWISSYRYSPGDTILWLNRTFVLNSSLEVECRLQLTSEYQAIEQQITVRNGDTAQYLPFPVESAFSLGGWLKGRGISLPNMTLTPDRYIVYPDRMLPAGWHNESSGLFTLPDKMWEEQELPGMLYVEFDLALRNWFGICTITQYSYEMRAGVGVKVISAKMPGRFRPYCIFVSGQDDHVIIGFKPFETPGPYDEFVPSTLGPNESVSVDLLWFFPQAKGDTMSIFDLEQFAEYALSTSGFHANRTIAEKLFAQANQLAAEGRVKQAIQTAQGATQIYQDLGKLSDAMFEEARKINATITTWESAAADIAPHPDRGSRAAILYSITVIVSLILAIAAWIHLKPRRSTEP